MRRRSTRVELCTASIWPGDLLGRLRGLHRKRFHFRRDHGKAASRLACARRFDRRIECKQVRLPGNIADQTDDFADVLNGVGKPRHVFVGRLRFGDRMRSDFGRLTDLAADFAD